MRIQILLNGRWQEAWLIEHTKLGNAIVKHRKYNQGREFCVSAGNWGLLW